MGRENQIHIGIFGRCNAGKSTLMNLLAGGEVAIVSPEGGTTTDPVRKSCEVLGFGPVVLIDTAGVDDPSPLGARRMARTREAMEQVDAAIVVFRRWGAPEDDLVGQLEGLGVPIVRVENRVGEPIDAERVFEDIKRALPEGAGGAPSMFGDRVGEGEAVLLVTPIDGAAPAGRLILPQVQAIRELLDAHAVVSVVQPEQVAAAMATVKPVLVVADSQVLAEVRAAVGASVEVTSFSILLASARGDRDLYERGLAAVDALPDGARILIAESCTHQTSCDDIGRVKIPRWLEEYTGRRFSYTVVAGLAPLPDDLATYSLAVQCGGCMVTRSQLRNRLRQIARAGVPVTNYGMLISKIRV
jgi:small GTP-binding protein